MQKSSDGYAPEPGNLAAVLEQMPELRDPEMPEYTIHEYETLLDSANMSPKHWLDIAHDIRDHYSAYDGFIVLHGTDTMAYTASALPFMLRGLDKPVILTGSQIPLCEIRNDGRDNIITALIIAANYAIPEVCLYFGERLLRGCRSKKVNADGFRAFDSPNFPPLGTAGIDISINWELIIEPEVKDNTLSPGLQIQELEDHVVAALRIFPGISAQLVDNLLQPPLKGLVLEAYGVGNGPAQDSDFIDALRRASDRGVVMVDCSQCLRGRVDLRGYKTGAALANAGVISGYDMTVEAALAKLYYLFSAGYDPEQVKSMIQKNLRGELTASLMRE